VVAWIVQQDSTELLDLVPLQDGRDYAIFRRLHKTQTHREALREQELFVNGLLSRIPKQHDTNDTPNLKE
jgi:hypothetical protein